MENLSRDSSRALFEAVQTIAFRLEEIDYFDSALSYSEKFLEFRIRFRHPVSVCVLPVPGGPCKSMMEFALLKIDFMQNS